jgi:hypothetical protein
MKENEKCRPDWIHLPRGTKARSLWESLHDAELLSCESDLLNRTVRLRFRVFYLVKDYPDIVFAFDLQEVTSVRADISVRWPGGCVRPNGASPEEWSRLIDEYQSKWRNESLSWDALESSLPTNPLEVHYSELATGADGRTLRMEGFLKGDKYDDIFCKVFAAFNGLAVSRSDGVDIDFKEFCRLGEVYWDAFAKRRRESDRQRRKSKK